MEIFWVSRVNGEELEVTSKEYMGVENLEDSWGGLGN